MKKHEKAAVAAVYEAALAAAEEVVKTTYEAYKKDTELDHARLDAYLRWYNSASAEEIATEQATRFANCFPTGVERNEAFGKYFAARDALSTFRGIVAAALGLSI